MLKETLLFLERNNHTQISAIRHNIMSILEQRGEIGEQTRRSGTMTTVSNIKIPNEIALTINEVIYDLIYKERVLTPGINRSNLELPFVHVSDIKKLEVLLDK